MKAKLTLELESPIIGENKIETKHTTECIFSEEDLMNIQRIGVDIRAHILDVMSKKLYETLLKNKTN